MPDVNALLETMKFQSQYAICVGASASDSDA